MARYSLFVVKVSSSTNRATNFRLFFNQPLSAVFEARVLQRYSLFSRAHGGLPKVFRNLEIAATVVFLQDGCSVTQPILSEH